ncbi:hypothetical protein GTG28_17720 [Vibrio sp. OCN044]|uniref:Uncharacterized protein n=1 Tax=Vibrio tetraodonis subsp. pristinus TaxID=2695891 RepID=A0A6L8M1S4_9VIBR|nr:hypothetical protein [Vibrio tetraodonis]MYM61070.1 hypothetical protein [Vibrio tetraodonis subsp. pristinus]
MTLVLLSGCASKYQPSPPVEREWIKKQDNVVATPEELKAAKDKCKYDFQMLQLEDIRYQIISNRYLTDVHIRNYSKKYEEILIEATTCMFNLGYVERDKVTTTKKTKHS